MLIQGRPYRRAADVVSPQESYEEGSSSESEGQWPGILCPRSPAGKGHFFGRGGHSSGKVSR